MKRVIDIHSHILPAVDDGCRSKEEALEMLKMYEDQDVEAVICTPHFGPCAFPGADVEGAFEWLKSTHSPVNLYLGNEVFVSLNTSCNIKSGKARSLAGSNSVLIEFEDWNYKTPAEEMIADCFALASTGKDLIVAHPERYLDLQLHRGKLKELSRVAKLQVNAYDVYDNQNDLTRDTAQYMILNRLASYIGSDAHGSVRRSPKLSTGVQWIYDHCYEDYADAIVHDNAEKIIKQGGE